MESSRPGDVPLREWPSPRVRPWGQGPNRRHPYGVTHHAVYAAQDVELLCFLTAAFEVRLCGQHCALPIGPRTNLYQLSAWSTGHAPRTRFVAFYKL